MDGLIVLPVLPRSAFALENDLVMDLSAGPSTPSARRALQAPTPANEARGSTSWKRPRPVPPKPTAEERRSTRARKRAKAHPGRPREVLALNSVSPAVQERYRAIFDGLVRFMLENGLGDPRTEQDLNALDRGLREFISDLFWQGRASGEGSAALAALGLHRPEVSRHGSHKMPLSRQAVAGFRRLDPEKSRLSLPTVLAAAIANELCAMGCWSGGVIVVCPSAPSSAPGMLVAQSSTSPGAQSLSGIVAAPSCLCLH